MADSKIGAEPGKYPTGQKPREMPVEGYKAQVFREGELARKNQGEMAGYERRDPK